MGKSFAKLATSTLTVTRKNIVSGKTTTDSTLISNAKCTEPVTPSKSFSIDASGIVSGVKRLVETFFENTTQIDFRQGDKVTVDGVDYKLSYFETGKFINTYHYFFVLERSN